MPLTTVASGSTGSIGTQTIDVVRAEPDRFEIVALGAWSSADTLVRQAHELRPKLVVIGDDRCAAAVHGGVPAGTEVRAGEAALADLGAVADVCVNGVVGFAGLRVTLAALAAGRRLALANKESLIAGGPVVRSVLGRPGTGTSCRSTPSTAPCTSASPPTPAGTRPGCSGSSSPPAEGPSGAAAGPNWRT